MEGDGHDCAALAEAFGGDCPRCSHPASRRPPSPAPKLDSTSGTVACHFCDAPVDPLGSTTYRLVHGWVRNRQQGGANAVTLREEQNRYACGECIRKARAGVSTDQIEADF